MPAVRFSDGSVKFVSRNKAGVEGTLELPCGQCIGCRLERSRQWAMRCLHEASLHDFNAFITLTYSDSNLPPGGSLHYTDFQLFMKRLRKRAGMPVRFYCGGEYGESGTVRPHFHACLFGYDFPDKVFYKKTGSGERIYTSKLLESVPVRFDVNLLHAEDYEFYLSLIFRGCKFQYCDKEIVRYRHHEEQLTAIYSQAKRDWVQNYITRKHNI